MEFSRFIDARVEEAIKAFDLDENSSTKLRRIGRRLVRIRKERGEISYSHSVYEVGISAYLLSKGFEGVEVEKEVGVERELIKKRIVERKLIIDVYALKNNLIRGIEVETSWVPTTRAKIPVGYRSGKEIGKIARYGSRINLNLPSDKEYEFGLALPPFYILNHHCKFFTEEKRDVEKLKNIVDRFYSRPHIPLINFTTAWLHKIYIVYVDEFKVIEMDAKDYFSLLEDYHEVYRLFI